VDPERISDEAADRMRRGAEAVVRSTDELLAELNDVTGELMAQIERRQPKHRLLRLRNDVVRNRDAFENHARGADVTLEFSVSSVVELGMHLALLTEARAHLSGWDNLMRQCWVSDFYDHFILTLGLRMVFRDKWGVQAELVPELQECQTPDLMIYQGGSAICAVEVKSKLALADPGGALTYANARKIIKHAIDRTGGSEEGQLRRGFPGVLAIAGFFIEPALVVLLHKAALEWFRRHQGRRKSLAGIMLVNLVVHSGVDPLRREGALDIQFARNRSYDLDTELVLLMSGTTLNMADRYSRWGPDTKIIRPEAVVEEGWEEARSK